MPTEPEDRIERLFAAEEAGITDDGFTERVLDAADRTLTRRRTAIFGAGLAGFGFAIGGIVEMTPHLPNLTGWADGLANAFSSAGVQEAVLGASDASYLMIAAILAGATCLLAAVTVQNR